MALSERYSHNISKKNRKWEEQDFMQFISIDPGVVNFCFRIERRYKDGRIIPIAFWKSQFKSNTYTNLLKKLDEYIPYYKDTHVVIIEKQPPRSILINRVMQHALTYFMVRMQDYPLLPMIIEISSKVKGNELGCPYNTNLKKWASVKARELLALRNDEWSISVMDYWKKSTSIPKNERKDDDLADTIVMIEAYCKKNNLPLTGERLKKPKFKIVEAKKI